MAIIEFDDITGVRENRKVFLIKKHEKSQKGIIIGNKGNSIKNIGTESRKDLERFFNKKVFLELNVKVYKDWRKNSNYLKKLGYN